MNGNLYARFQARFAQAGEKPALVDSAGHGISFSALDHLASQFAGALLARGVGAGDRVVVQIEKSVGAVGLYLGCLRLGAVFTPLNTAYTEAEVDYFLGDCEPKLFIGAKARADGATPSCEMGVSPLSGFWAEALNAQPHNDVAARAGDDIAAILYTSGTTGRSKGAMLSHDNLASNAETLVSLWGFEDGDVLLHALPIFHVHGLFVALHCAFLNGSTTIFLPKFDAAEIAALLPRASVLMGVPTFYTRLLALKDFGRAQCAQMRLFISGSAPLLAETHKEFEARTGHRILERYGMTEAGMVISNPLKGERIAGTIGYALPGVSVRIADGEGREIKRGEIGIIEFKGPNVFKGYWRMPDKTAEEFRGDGFFISGDMGVMEADGRVSIVGRAKDLIISGGFNIYPKEIEEVLDAVEGVAESAVIGAPDADFGEAVIGYVTAKPGATLSIPALEAACKEKLARFKHPKRIFILEDLPRNAMGKVQKNVLRERYKTDASAHG
ncbi:MAG: AMP-binding protein [Hyphomonadaceae bacterium]